MRKTIKSIPVIALIVLLTVMSNSCSTSRMASLLNIDTGELKELTFNDGRAKIQYDPSLWRETKLKMKEGTYSPAIHVKSEDKSILISAAKVNTTKSEPDYVIEFKNFMQNNSVDGKIEEDKLNNHTLLSFAKNEGSIEISYSVLVVKDGNGYYEVTFACPRDLYSKYKDEAHAIMGTFKVVIEEGFVRVGKPGYGYINVPQDFIDFRDLDDKSGRLFQKARRDNSFIVTILPGAKKVSFNEFAAVANTQLLKMGPSTVMTDATINSVQAVVIFQYYKNEDLTLNTILLNESDSYKMITVEYNGDQEELYKKILNSYKPDK